MSLRTLFLASSAALALAAACSTTKDEINKTVPVYIWQRVSEDANLDTLQTQFREWRSHGVTGVCIDARNLDQIRGISARAHAEGLEYHAWVPSMLRSGLPHEWYAVNRLGESADEKPSYVDNYRFLDPANPEVQAYLLEQYTAVANIPDVDYVRLDFIRYPDVILANALSAVYGLENIYGEYAPADYCYCDRCVNTFKEQTGIDIRAVEDPSQVREWAQYRCDQLTFFVDKVTSAVHKLGKKVSVDVFPGPVSYAEHMVRQQWNQWMADMFFPMNYPNYYKQGPEWLNDVVAEEVQSAGGAPVISSLRVHRNWRNVNPDANLSSRGLMPSELSMAIHNSLANGATGICLFNGNRMDEAFWTALEEALQINY